MGTTPPSLLAPVIAVRAQVKVVTDKALVPFAGEVALATRITADTCTPPHQRGSDRPLTAHSGGLLPASLAHTTTLLCLLKHHRSVMHNSTRQKQTEVSLGNFGVIQVVEAVPETLE